MTIQPSNIWLKGRLDINVLLACILGTLLLIIMIVMATKIPNPSGFQIKIFTVTLALAAGGIGATIPGFLNIQHKNFFRAGGAMALTVMVIYFNPQITSSTVNLVEPAEPAEPIALNYLELTDGGKISLSWNAMDPDLRSLSFDSLEVMEKMYGSFRAPLGNIIIRKTVGVQSVQSPAGFPVGLYRGVSYITHFSSDNECRMEYVVLRATQDLVWKVASYSITPYLVHCS